MLKSTASTQDIKAIKYIIILNIIVLYDFDDLASFFISNLNLNKYIKHTVNEIRYNAKKTVSSTSTFCSHSKIIFSSSSIIPNK